jgi:hypothetical protein
MNPEFDFLVADPGPKIPCAELGLELAPGLGSMQFSGDVITIVVAGRDEIQVDLSGRRGEQEGAAQSGEAPVCVMLSAMSGFCDKPTISNRFNTVVSASSRRPLLRKVEMSGCP